MKSVRLAVLAAVVFLLPIPSPGFSADLDVIPHPAPLLDSHEHSPDTAPAPAGTELLAEPEVTWAHYYLGLGTGQEIVNSIRRTGDGGFIAAGYTTSFGAGGKDVWVLKFDAAGRMAWQRTFGGSKDDYAVAVREVAGGGYVVAASTTSISNNWNIWILRLDAAGTVLWQRMYNNGGSPSDDRAYGIETVSDGGFVVAGQANGTGTSTADPWFLKLASDGAVVWQVIVRATGGSDWAASIIETTDGGFIAAGRNQGLGAGGIDAWVFKLSAAGVVEWQHTYGGAGLDEARAVLEITGGGYIVAGYTNTFGNEDILLLALDASGTPVWTKTYGGAGSEQAAEIRKTADGGWVVIGWEGSWGSADPLPADFWLLHLDGGGEILWQKSYGGVLDHYGYTLDVTDDGGVVMGGVMAFPWWDLLVLKTDANGGMDASCPFGEPTPAAAVARSLSTATPSYSLPANAPATTTPAYTLTVSTSADSPACSCALAVPVPAAAVDRNVNLDSGIDIAWTAPSDWGDNGVGSENRGYRVYRDGLDISGLLPVTTLTWFDDPPLNHKNYVYRVDAINGCGHTAPSADRTAMDHIFGRPAEASPPGSPLTASKPVAGSTVAVDYTPATCATDHVFYWGEASGTLSGLNWTGQTCALGISGQAAFDPGALAAGRWIYFVVVGTDLDDEGSYGRGSDLLERIESSNRPQCLLAQNLVDTCP